MFKLNTIIAISLFGLTACGGGGGGFTERPVVLDGIFKDSNVTGLSFVSGDQKAITDAGKFKYESGENVTFSLGGIDFGTALAKPVMTPIDLVTDGKLSDTEVINRVRLLMMLDEDNTPSNGIVISPKVQAKAERWSAVDFSAVDFLNEVNAIQLEATAEDGVAHTLPSSDDAIAHLKTTLLCSSAGAFVGTYTGSESGNIAFMVDPVSGEVSGASYDSASQVSYGVNSLTEIDYENDFDFVAGEDSAKKFTGSLSSSDEMQGSWLNVSNNTKTGSFSGERIGGSGNAIYRYTAVFTGDNGKGVYTFDVASNNAVTGLAYNVSSKAQSVLTGTINDNTLDVTAADGTAIDGLIDETTRALTGVWANVSVLDAGTFSGGGCKLN
ncbi:MAG: hypothetical protein ACKE8R_08935 [Methylophagaceae bacterium]